MTAPDWAYYRSFLAVATHGSISVASAHIGLSAPTISRHITALEVALESKLFIRGKHLLRLTDAAQSLLPYVRAMSESSEGARRVLSGEGKEPTGSVRLAAPLIIASEVLPDALTAFRRDNPRISIELVVSNKTQDLLIGEVDIAVRMQRPTQEALIAKRVGSIEFGIFAHKDYVARFGEPATFAHLSEHSLIGPDRDPTEARARGVPHMAAEMFALRSDDERAKQAVLRSGFGMGLMQISIASRAQGLARVLPAISYTNEMWLSMHEDLRSTRRVWLLFQHLATFLREYYSPKRREKSPS